MDQLYRGVKSIIIEVTLTYGSLCVNPDSYFVHYEGFDSGLKAFSRSQYIAHPLEKLLVVRAAFGRASRRAGP